MVNLVMLLSALNFITIFSPSVKLQVQMQNLKQKLTIVWLM